MDHEAAAYRAEADRLKALRVESFVRLTETTAQAVTARKRADALEIESAPAAEIDEAKAMHRGIRNALDDLAEEQGELSLRIESAESGYARTAGADVRAETAERAGAALERMRICAREIERLMGAIDDVKEILTEEFDISLWELTPRGDYFGGRRVVEHIVAGGFARLLPELRITDPEENRREAAYPHAPLPFSGQETFDSLIGDRLEAQIAMILAGAILPDLSRLPLPSNASGTMGDAPEAGA